MDAAERVLIVYYSLEGNTGFVADECKKHLNLSVRRLIVQNEPPKRGIMKFLKGGSSALRGLTPELANVDIRLDRFQTIILACPVWAGTCPPAMNSFLKEYPIGGKDIYLIGTSAGGNAEKMFDTMKSKLAGNNILGTLSLTKPLKNKEDTAAKVADFCAKMLAH